MRDTLQNPLYSLSRLLIDKLFCLKHDPKTPERGVLETLRSFLFVVYFWLAQGSDEVSDLQENT